MKKILFMFALLISAVVGVNAQTAYEASKVFDNVSVGVTGGISSPLNFNNTLFIIHLLKCLCKQTFHINICITL